MRKPKALRALAQARLAEHVAELKTCRLCPLMRPPPISGGPVLSKVMLVGQAPGVHEPVIGKPFAWTAGRTLFSWFQKWCGISEERFRASIYMAAVCRCFPGKNSAGGDRVPNADEVQNCSRWMRREFEILQPELVIPVGRLGITQFMPCGKLDVTIGKTFRAHFHEHEFDLIPLPHPSGASPWPRIEPGKTLLDQAMKRIREHTAFPHG